MTKTLKIIVMMSVWFHINAPKYRSKNTWSAV